MGRQDSRAFAKNIRRNPAFYPTMLDDTKKFQQTEKEICKKVSELTKTDNLYTVDYHAATIDIFPFLAYLLSQFDDSLSLAKAYTTYLRDNCELIDSPTLGEKGLKLKNEDGEYLFSKDQGLKDSIFADENASEIFPIPSDKMLQNSTSALVYEIKNISPKECLKQLLLIVFRSYTKACYGGKKHFRYSEYLEEDNDTALVTPFFTYLITKWMLETLKNFNIFIGYIPKPVNIFSALEHFMPTDSIYYREVLLNNCKISSPSVELCLERDAEYVLLYCNNRKKELENIATGSDDKKKKLSSDILIQMAREERLRRFSCFEKATQFVCSEEILRSPIHARNRALLFLMDDWIKKCEQEKEAEKPKEDTVPRSRYNAIKQQLVENSNDYEKLEKELEQTKKELEAEKKKKQPSSFDTKETKPQESSSDDNLLIKDQYEIVRELAILRQENAKLKRQINLRDKLDIAPEKKKMLEQIESFCTTVPRETKIEFLNTKNIIIVGGEKSNLVNALRKLGVTANIDEKYDDGKIKAKYDIYVCLIKKMSHSLDDQTTKAAKSNNGVLLYFDYMNAERLVDEMYEACMNKLDK